MTHFIELTNNENANGTPKLIINTAHIVELQPSTAGTTVRLTAGPLRRVQESADEIRALVEPKKAPAKRAPRAKK